MEMIAYKLCRQLKNGDITSLFINKKVKLIFSQWLEAECHPTKGFKERSFWHCTAKPVAPHLSMKNRVWVMVEMEDFEEFLRPASQGGLWYLAKRIKLIDVIPNIEYVRGDIVVCKWGYNDVLKKPFEFLYEFGYYTHFGCVVYNHGECNMQDSGAFKLYQVRRATSEDIDKLTWGD